MRSGDPTERHFTDTTSGVRLNLDDARSEDIRIEDVAGGLSKVCRFGAQALEYYSVPRHVLLVQRLLAEAARGARFRELYAMLGLRAAVHAAGTLDIKVGAANTKGVMSWDGSS